MSEFFIMNPDGERVMLRRRCGTPKHFSPVVSSQKVIREKLLKLHVKTGSKSVIMTI